MKIGTRGSELALVQAQLVSETLAKALNILPEIVVIRTQGDRVTDRPLRELEGQGYFTKEIEEALLDERIDVAVHSFKDLPSRPPNSLELAAITAREDPADLLVIRPDSYHTEAPTLPIIEGAVVGSSAIRRQQQLLALRPDAIVKDLRGNVPTRIATLLAGQFDAIFLASAGARRLELDMGEVKVVRLDPQRFVPAPGQGALAVQMRAGDPQFAQVRRAMHHAQTETATRIERSVQAHFGGGCGLPLGAYAEPTGDTWQVYGFWGGDEEEGRWANVWGNDPDTLADHLFKQLMRETG